MVAEFGLPAAAAGELLRLGAVVVAVAAESSELTVELAKAPGVQEQASAEHGEPVAAAAAAQAVQFGPAVAKEQDSAVAVVEAEPVVVKEHKSAAETGKPGEAAGQGFVGNSAEVVADNAAAAVGIGVAASAGAFGVERNAVVTFAVEDTVELTATSYADHRSAWAEG